MKKSNILKKLLLGSSALALIGSSTNAMGAAVVRTQTAQNITLGTGAGLDAIVPLDFKDGQALTLTQANAIGGASAITLGNFSGRIANITLDGNAGGNNGNRTFTISNNINIDNFTATNFNKFVFNINAGKTLQFNVGGAFAGDFDVDGPGGGANGTLQVNANMTFSPDQKIGANQALALVDINANVTFNNATPTATSFNIQAGKTLTIGAANVSNVTGNVGTGTGTLVIGARGSVDNVAAAKNNINVDTLTLSSAAGGAQFNLGTGVKANTITFTTDKEAKITGGILEIGTGGVNKGKTILNTSGSVLFTKANGGILINSTGATLSDVVLKKITVPIIAATTNTLNANIESDIVFGAGGGTDTVVEVNGNYTGTMVTNTADNAFVLRFKNGSSSDANPQLIDVQFTHATPAAANVGQGIVEIDTPVAKVSNHFQKNGGVNNLHFLKVNAGRKLIVNTEIKEVENIKLNTTGILDIIDGKNITTAAGAIIPDGGVNSGVINTQGASIIKKIGSNNGDGRVGALTLSGNGKTVTHTDVDLNVERIDFVGDTTLKLGGVNATTISANDILASGSSDTSQVGAIDLNGKDAIITGGNPTNNKKTTINIGASDKYLKEIDLSTKTLTLGKAIDNTTTNLYVANIKNGNLKVETKTVNFNLTKTTNLGKIEIVSDTAAVAGAATVNFEKGSITATEVMLNDGNTALSNELHLKADTILDAYITTGTASKGTVLISGTNVQVQKNIGATNTGAAGNAIDTVQFAANGELKFGGTKINTTNGIDFNLKDATIAFTNKTGDIEISAIKGFKNSGKLSADGISSANTLIVKDDLKSGTDSFGEIDLKGSSGTASANLEFKGDAFVNQITVGGSDDPTITLDKASGEYKIGEIVHTDGKTNITLADDATFLEGTNLARKDGNNDVRLNVINVGAHELKLEKGINITANEINGVALGAIHINSGGNGGTSEINAQIGKAAASIDTITLSSGTGTLKQDVYVNAGITVANGTLSFEGSVRPTTVNGNINAIAIQSTGVGLANQKVIFSNSDTSSQVVIDAVVGADNTGNNISNIKAIEVNSDNIKFEKGLYYDSLAITATGAATVEFAKELRQDKTITTKGNNEHTLRLLGDQTFGNGAVIGTTQNPFKSIEIKGDKTLTLQTQAKINSGITTSDNDKNTVNITTPVANTILTLSNIGATGKLFKMVDVKAGVGVDIKGGVWTKDLAIGANSKTTIRTGLNTVNAATVGVGGELTLELSQLNTNIKGLTPGKGKVIFTSKAGTALNVDVGEVTNRLNAIDFNKQESGAYIWNNNFYANTLTIKSGAAIVLNNNVTSTGATIFEDKSSIDLGNKTLTLAQTPGGGTTTSKMSGQMNITVEVANNDSTSGNIKATGTSHTLDLSNVTSGTITVDNTTSIAADSSRNYPLITSEGTLTPIPDNIKINVVIKDNFSTGSYNNKSNTIIINNDFTGGAKRLASPFVGTVISRTAFDNINVFAGTPLGNAANRNPKFKNDAERFAQFAEGALGDPAPSTEFTGNVISSAHSTINNAAATFNATVGTRNTGNSTSLTSIENESGISAGDDHTRNGVWIAPLYSNATQKKKNNRSGFENTSYGFVLGGDTQLNDDMTVGLAFGYLTSDVKMKNFQTGNKSDIDTLLVSIYNSLDLTNEWVLQGNASFSSSRVKNREKRVNPTTLGDEIAKSSYDVATYGFEALVGYKYDLQDFRIVPLAGISYDRINDSGYRETGTNGQDSTITRKDSNKFEL
ncbi:MAG: autotransporter outer membrane beta-barrel domain-containing protein, partial [Rickettsiaceae bacterium]|nr:autotransporter outer membrane beta-barrel domain-containing protein [Rickettsiaceae bacterium]